MKKYIFIAISLLMLSACNRSETNKVSYENDSLFSIINERDSALSDFIISFNEIETNLDSVAVRQQIIYLNTNNHGEFKGNKKTQIISQIAAINSLMDKNRKEITNLKKRLAGSKNKNILLEKTISTLTIQLSRKDYELCELNLKLDALNIKVTKLNTTVDSLSSQNYLKSIVIDYQISKMHTAYYIVGESKYLSDEKIIDRKGGLLGIGRTSELSENFDNALFTEIDFTKTTSIPLNSFDIKIITNHPTDSYMIERDDTNRDMNKNIVITNPEKFWSTSKYLVIVKK